MTGPHGSCLSVAQGVVAAFWEGVFVSMEFALGGLNQDTQIPQGRDCQRGPGPILWGAWFSGESSFDWLPLTKNTIGPALLLLSH